MTFTSPTHASNPLHTEAGNQHARQARNSKSYAICLAFVVGTMLATIGLVTMQHNGLGDVSFAKFFFASTVPRGRPVSGALGPAIQLPKIRVLLEEERYCVVEKPAGMAVHRNEFTKKCDVVLVQALREQLDREVAPVHRLDGGTSGCLFISFDPEMTKQLQAAMQDDRARKIYYAFCRGNASHLKDVVVNRPIKDDKGLTREAQTHVDCVAGCGGGPDRSSLLVARPLTGRWHQIRKHLKGLNHPIIGDSSHGDLRINRYWREEHGMAHLGLHCAEISLTLDDGHRIEVRCPVRPDLLDTWQRAPWWEQACEALPILRADLAEAMAGKKVSTVEETME